jgi:hypothetical protein
MDIAEVRKKFPQYADMSDGELASALHKKFYADMPAEEFASKIGLTPPKAEPPKAPGRSFGDEAARQGGLTARYALEGPLQLFNSVIGDPVNTAINYGIRGVNKLGANVPELDMPSQVTQRNYDRAFPQPETPTEHVVGAVSKGLSGGGITTAAALRAAPALQSLPMIRSIAGAPVVDLASAGVGGGASEAAKQGGLGPAWQLAAGAVAPMGVSGVAGAARSAAAVPRELVRPLTKGGAEQIAADTIGKMTQNKDRAISNLSRYNTLVARGEQVGAPGFSPTGAAVAGDYGLAGGQQLIARGDANPRFAERAANNNEALATDLGRLNATEKAVEMYKAKRDNITAPMRQQVFAGAKGDVDYGRVDGLIVALRNSPAGGKQETARALDTLRGWVRDRAKQGRTSAEDAYALHQDINDLIKGRVNDEKGAIRLSAGMATAVKKELADVIEDSAPGFKKYLEKYSRLSRPIERLEVITEKLGDQNLTKVTNALPQVTDNGATFSVSQDKLRRQIDAINTETTLAPRQRDVLERVLGNLNAESFASRGGKQPGSDTYQNLASANFMNRILGETIGSSGLGKMAAGPLNLAFRPLEARINDKIVEAFQDPKKLEELLRKARTSRGLLSLSGIQDFAAPRLSGGLLGSLAQ